MEFKYHRELNHNYLVMKYPGNVDGYKYRMLATNKLNGFLKLGKRYINCESYLFYEITSMQSLTNRYALKGMNSEELRNLLSEISMAISVASEYLLDEEGIVFSPDFIMENLGDKKHYFLYSPEGSEEWTFKKFSEELLSLVDQNDDLAVQMVYDLCELSGRDGALTTDIISIVCNDNIKEEIVTESFKDDEIWKDSIESDIEVEESEEESKNDIGELKFTLIIGGLFAVLELILLYIKVNYILNEKESIIVLLLMALSFLMIVLCSGNIARKYSKKRFGNKDTISEEEIMDDYFYNDVEYKNYYPKEKINKKVENNIEYGQTIVLDENSFGSGNRLYSIDREKAGNIDLNNLPITIGKQLNLVDVVLSSKAVSRMHARIYNDTDNRLILEDLNSSNGTFINNIRLHPQEKVFIKPGDEVRFADVRFDYR
ncbi:MAG: FHA domain-containing protein [Butyrivibrio sp.]|nr:FHA domain-containing protein [Butyrivibrio sp.]